MTYAELYHQRPRRAMRVAPSERGGVGLSGIYLHMLLLVSV